MHKIQEQNSGEIQASQQGASGNKTLAVQLRLYNDVPVHTGMSSFVLFLILAYTCIYPNVLPNTVLYLDIPILVRTGTNWFVVRVSAQDLENGMCLLILE